MSIANAIFDTEVGNAKSNTKLRSILLPTLVNKCGAIGLSLLPMLIVDRDLSAGESSWVMSIVRISSVIGVFLGGSLTDRYLSRTVILLSFVFSAIGLGLLPFSKTFITICFFGILAQVGQSIFSSSSQLMMKRNFLPHEQRQAVGWLRSISNLGQIMSFTIGWLFSFAGPLGLMLFDSITSVFAFLVGQKTLPMDEQVSTSIHREHQNSAESWNKKGFWLTAIMGACLSFFYELFIDSSAIQLRLQYGADGLAIFSQLMILNTVICALLSVKASKIISAPHWALPAGVFMCLTACLTLLVGSPFLLFVGAFVLTFGEIIYFSLSTFVLLSFLPHSKTSGSRFGLAALIPIAGKTLAGAAAFQVTSNVKLGLTFIFVIGIFSALISVLTFQSWRSLSLKQK